MSRIGQGGVLLSGEDVTIERDGLSLPAMLYRPEGTEGRGPVVVLCPGGIGTGLFEIVEWLAASLRDAGIMALTLSWRSGSPEHDPDDARIAIDWLLERDDVDPQRIGIFGMSRGGNAALRAAAFDPRIATVVTFGPVTHLRQQAEGTKVYAPGRHAMLVGWLGDPEANHAFYEKVEAISYADRIKQPMLMVHGQHDMHAPPEQSIWMKEAIERAGNDDVRLEIVPGMGHYGDTIPNGYGFDQLRAIILPFVRARL
jgi:dipeptidyl aminopeptidase/acylaminoacyl peptidase